MTGLAEDGALIVQLADGSETHVRAGEISVLG
jgi:flagellar basal body rod protein FlgF